MTRPDAWSSPRPHTDASLRFHHYGPVQPMDGPSRPIVVPRWFSLLLIAFAVGLAVMS